MRRNERGFFLLPLVCLLALAAGAAFLLFPSLDREQVLEANRLRREQARAAAEGAAELAIHLGEAVTDVRIGSAVAQARFLTESRLLAVGEVPGPRDSVVRVTLEVEHR